MTLHTFRAEHTNSVEHTWLTPERTIPLRCGCMCQSALEVSSCGALVAGVTSVGSVAHSFQLFIFQLATGSMHQQPLHASLDAEGGELKLHWAQDASALLVCSALGRRQLFRLVA